MKTANKQIGRLLPKIVEFAIPLLPKQRNWRLGKSLQEWIDTFRWLLRRPVLVREVAPGFPVLEEYEWREWRPQRWNV
jgi:hypothetical protein